MHLITSASADILSDEYHRLAGEHTSTEAREAFLHAAYLLNAARLHDFTASHNTGNISPFAPASSSTDHFSLGTSKL